MIELPEEFLQQLEDEKNEKIKFFNDNYELALNVAIDIKRFFDFEYLSRGFETKGHKVSIVLKRDNCKFTYDNHPYEYGYDLYMDDIVNNIEKEIHNEEFIITNISQSFCKSQETVVSLYGEKFKIFVGVHRVWDIEDIF